MPKAIRTRPTVHREPLWKGPQESGITFSLLTKFLECRERFRLLVVEGLREHEGFNRSLEFGNLWHEAEEAYCRTRDLSAAEAAIHTYAAKLRAEYPGQDDEISQWSMIARYQFPEYVTFWKGHALEKRRTPIWEEQTFAVPYTLPSGRVVFLRGKFDAVVLFGKRDVYLQENKTKGTIDEEGITKTVDRNLQSMLYQIALRQYVHASHPRDKGTVDGHRWDYPPETLMRGTIKGTLYNVVRRPLSDRYAIKRRKDETLKSFCRRAGEFVVKENPEHYFKRWQVMLSTADIDRFRQRTFDPMLEQLCDWWESIEGHPFDPWQRYSVMDDRGKPTRKYRPVGINPHHYQTPWGCYNSLASGWRGSYFTYLTTGSRIGLDTVDTLFPELGC